MEEREQEEGSSSQRDNITITSIDERGPYTGILLSDSSSFFILPEDYSKLCLNPGDILTDEQKYNLQQLNKNCNTYKAAISLLAFAPNSKQLLKQKLYNKGFDSKSVNKTIEKLCEKNLLNDKKFAENWVASRLSRNPESPFALKAALMRKGIDRDIAEEILKDFTPESEVYIEAFEKALEKQLRKKSATAEKIKITLARKGYPLSLINKYLNKN